MEPLTPNTSAFLSYLASSVDPNSDSSNNDKSFTSTFDNSLNPFDAFPSSFDVTKNPASFPPSAFFPIPGRDTPEDTPPSSTETTHSPDKRTTAPNPTSAPGLSESDGESPQHRGKKNHKRKAGQGHLKHEEDDEDEEDSASDFAEGHEDKKAHPNAKVTNKKGGRKSLGGEEGKGGKDVSKAARRKEQNRAAQKAFRERREAKVKDVSLSLMFMLLAHSQLEEKLAELEAKSFGTSVENENLRGILKRLQEENVALRQAAFTFSMPANGASQSGTGTNTPLASVQHQQVKPPTPAHTVSDDSLRSVHDQDDKPSRKTSAIVGDSPDSLVSVGSRSGSESNGNYGAINLFNDPSSGFDAAALGRPGLGKVHSSSSSNTNSTQDVNTAGRSSSVVSPASSNGQTELDALWATFLQQGAPPKDQTTPAWNLNGPTSFPMYSAQNTSAMSFATNDAKVGAPVQNGNNFDKFAFRDTSVPQQPQFSATQASNGQSLPTSDPWAAMNDNSVDNFLASLTGSANNAAIDNDGGINDDDFNAQIAKILGSSNASPSDAFALPGVNPFSPTNYLNMSPSPMVPASMSASNGPSPQTNSGSSVSASASPESSTGQYDVSRGVSVSSAGSPYQAGWKENEQIHIVDEQGKIIKPSELWVRMGMQHEVSERQPCSI